jgi:hypothetical protein
VTRRLSLVILISVALLVSCPDADVPGATASIEITARAGPTCPRGTRLVAVPPGPTGGSSSTSRQASSQLSPTGGGSSRNGCDAGGDSGRRPDTSGNRRLRHWNPLRSGGPCHSVAAASVNDRPSGSPTGSADRNATSDAFFFGERLGIPHDPDAHHRTADSASEKLARNWDSCSR